MTKTPKLTRAKNIAEWTTYDKQVAELAQRLLKKETVKDDTLVDESMFVQIDSSPKEAGEKVERAIPGEEETETRVKDEL